MGDLLLQETASKLRCRHVAVDAVISIRRSDRHALADLTSLPSCEAYIDGIRSSRSASHSAATALRARARAARAVFWIGALGVLIATDGAETFTARMSDFEVVEADEVIVWLLAMQIWNCLRLAAASRKHRCLVGEVEVLGAAVGRERRRADTDDLTGLARREVLLARDAERAAANPAEYRRLVLVDLDDFKVVNDEFGHPAGDAVLVEVARRLTRFFGSQAVAARVGGDEFAVLSDGSEPLDVVALRESLADPIEIGAGRSASPSASIGWAFGNHSLGLQSLYELADAELLGAKRGRRQARM